MKKLLMNGTLISLCCLTGVSMANVVTILNGSPQEKVLHIQYQEAYAKNHGQKPEFGSTHTIDVRHGTPITLQMKKGYKYVGIVPLSINGHSLNGNNKFLQPQQCYAVTSAKIPSDKLIISAYISDDGQHGVINCRDH